jgi:hypothetical protein
VSLLLSNISRWPTLLKIVSSSITYFLRLDGGIDSISLWNLDLPYNKYTSNTNPNYAYKTPIQYGKVTYVVKSAPGTGVVTAPILISSEGDEIDFEMLGGK